MSAQLDSVPRYRRMTAEDIDAVMAVETAIYPHPWTRGNFADSLAAGYHCWIVECGGDVVGYTVAAIAAGEAHLLNLSVAGPWQRQGLGRDLLAFVLKLARDYAAATILLEVRPSNAAARALYAAAGFTEIGVRRGYYPAGAGREDAIVLQLALQR
jgi:ribosomal-protein-alanine N-acetyltransferase